MTTKQTEGYTEAQLTSAFDIVSDPTDWRAPIEFRGILHEEDIAAIRKAVPFYTATEARVTYHDDASPCSSYRDVTVKSVGYRAGPAGP